jgi:hypothetical protein
MRVYLTLTEFSAGDVERVTELGTALQRDWRRRGLIPPAGKRARFDVFALTELWVMKMLTEQGIGPAVSARVARQWALGIVQFALGDPHAYAGHVERVLEWDADLLAIRVDDKPSGGDAAWGGAVKTLCFEITADADYTAIRAANPERFVPADKSAKARAEWLAACTLQMQGGVMYVAPYPFLIWWPGDRFESRMSVDAAFRDDRRGYTHGLGRALVLDAVSLAKTLLHRAGRPLVTVAFEDTPKGKSHA